MQKNYRTAMDYTIGLLTGRWQKKVNSEGKLVDEFVPATRNENRPLQELMGFTGRDLNEVLMDVGLRHPLTNINQEEFRKTSHEKWLLKKFKKEYRERIKLTGPQWRMIGVFTF